MEYSRVSLLQKAVRNITTDPFFRDRWMSLSSLNMAVNCRYTLGGVPSKKRELSLFISELNLTMDNLSVQNDIGFYSGKNGTECYLFVQNTNLLPPILPPLRQNKSMWSAIKGQDA